MHRPLPRKATARHLAASRLPRLAHLAVALARAAAHRAQLAAALYARSLHIEVDGAARKREEETGRGRAKIDDTPGIYLMLNYSCTFYIRLSGLDQLYDAVMHHKF
ncbi:hypothetical protein GUJ93_ZPchr0001g31782 [Zizania palustris]|uniref:Uncharacterized protein n=1 Tax=Zizania palustris TaxID=103762 RepID=A0A8J5RVD9_ZIZPA|nr:hypothetical protein GUJ93_ZPchr0001g31782 [Zizania palustris]